MAVAEGRGKAADAVLNAADDDDHRQLATYPLHQPVDARSKRLEAHEPISLSR